MQIIIIVDFVLILNYVRFGQTIENWRSAISPNTESVTIPLYQHIHNPGQCELYKVDFIPNSHQQPYIQYKTVILEMKQFTLCYWVKFSNHNTDHPIFSYAVPGQSKEIYSWVANTDQSSYLCMSINGQTFHRLNYPFKINRWYHVCQSWNGFTGEWQVWINAERVGRGFHNRLVGHIIRANGAVISGQEQIDPDPLYSSIGIVTSKSRPRRGMFGELTMLQLYKVALTAGKAHRDHKHHHAHQFDHHGNQLVTTTSPLMQHNQRTVGLSSHHPLLTAGQVNPMLRLNLARSYGYKALLPSSSSSLPSHYQLFKRSHNNTKTMKRELFLNGDNYLVGTTNNQLQSLGDGYLGLVEVGVNQQITNPQHKTDEREPAENEVKAIMQLCTGCDLEPFERALVFSWRIVSKKLYSGAFYTLAVPECRAF